MDSSDRLPRHLLIAFALALVIYASFFTCDQALRRRRGPWMVTFTTNMQGDAAILVNEHALRITNVQISFTGEFPTNRGVVHFDSPQKPIPFGRTKFEDLTFLPGSVAFDLFGHEVELLPRTLYLNKREYPWRSGEVHQLKSEEKLPPGSSYDPRAKRRILNRGSTNHP